MSAANPSADAPTLSSLPPRPSCGLRMGISGHRLQTGRSFDVDVVHNAMISVFNDVEAWLAAVHHDAYAAGTHTLSLPRRSPGQPCWMAHALSTWL